MDPRDKKPAEASAVVIRHGEMPNLILHGKRSDSGQWSIPGGHVHTGEDIKSAAVREIKEETGLELNPDDLEHIGTEHYNKPEKDLTVHLFLCKKPYNHESMDFSGDKDKEFEELKFIDPLTHDNLYQPNGESILVTYLKGNLNKPEIKKSEESLQKSQKELKAMYGPDIQPHQENFVNWATSKLPNGNWQEWAVKNHIKNPEQFNEQNIKNIEHFAGSKHIPNIAKVRFDQHDIKQGLEAFKAAEDEYNKKALSNPQLVIPSKKTSKLMDVGDGYGWYLLNKPACEAEGAAMGHCGNVPSQKKGQNVLSLRKEIKIGDKTYHEPVSTFILKPDGKSIGEMKGRANLIPQPKYHKYIKKLFENSSFLPVGGGYLEGNNFHLDDLSHEDHDDLISKRPELAEYSSRNSPELQTKLAQSNDTEVLRNLAENQNLHPELQNKLAQSNDKYVLRSLARNQNLHPELQNKLAQSNDTEVLRNLAETPNLHPELQNKLAQSNDTEVLYSLARNQNLHPEAQTKLAQSNDKYVLRNLAETPNLHPELQNKLAQSNDKYLLYNLARNQNLHPEAQTKLAQSNNTEVLHDLARNLKVDKQIQKAAIQKLKELDPELAEEAINELKFKKLNLESENNKKMRGLRVKEYFDRFENPTKKSEKLDKDQGRIAFKKLNVPSRPDQEVRELTTPRQFEITSRHFANKYSPGKSTAQKKMDAAQLQYSIENNIGGTITNEEGKFSTPFMNMNIKFNSKRVDPNFIKEHEGFHHLMNTVREKYGHENAGNILNSLISHIHPEDVKNIENSLIQRNYKKKNDPLAEQIWNEEIINHVRDFVHFSVAREGFSEESGARIKSAWKKMQRAAKDINLPLTSQQPKKLVASEKLENNNTSNLKKSNKPKKAKNLRRFYLNRKKDVNGVSGEGIVAVGVQFPNGKCVLNWTTETPSFNFYNSINDIKHIHGHGDSTEIHFMDDLNKSEKEKKLEKAYENKRLKWKYLRKFPEHKLPFMFLNSRIK